MRFNGTLRMIAAMTLCCGLLRAEQNTTVLDRVVAVVNNQAILSSDVSNELRLSVLDGTRGTRRSLDPPRALQLLISRTLIQQQINQVGMQAPEITDADVATRLKQLREQLPACVQAGCATDAGWAAFLQKNGLTEPEVTNYLRLRMQVLGFIAMRFRQGIQIPQDQVEKYYRETLLPQYPKGETPPPLKDVSQRIEEILLQQQVTALFDTWLTDLRKQGDVEVLDPSLEPAKSTSGDNP